MVEVLEPFAGKVRTFKAESDFPFANAPAISLQVRAPFLPHSASPAMRDLTPLPRDIVRKSKEGTAYPAVQTTGCNLFWCKEIPHFCGASILPLSVSPETTRVERFSIMHRIAFLAPFNRGFAIENLGPCILAVIIDVELAPNACPAATP